MIAIEFEFDVECRRSEFLHDLKSSSTAIAAGFRIPTSKFGRVRHSGSHLAAESLTGSAHLPVYISGAVDRTDHEFGQFRLAFVIRNLRIFDFELDIETSVTRFVEVDAGL